MITIKEVIAWLKIKDPGLEGKVFNSAINGNLTECVGVYARRHGLVQPQAVGLESKYGIKSITALIHWSKNANTCEEKAIALWEVIKGSSTKETIGNRQCWVVANQAPVSVGQDNTGVYETILDFDIYYRKG